MTKTAVVILNWNGLSYLQQFLPVLITHTTRDDVDLYVADNHSDDASVEFLNSHFPQIKVIQLDQNYGFAGGYNRALALIEASYYLLLNSDVEVTAGWLDVMIEHLDNHPQIAACQPKILDFRKRSCFEHAGAAGGFIDFLGYPFCRGRLLNVVEEDHGQYDQAINVFWATGACLMVRAEVFRDCGGFDPDFFAHMEEIDLCWRIKNAGHQIACLPFSAIYHVGGGTLQQEHPHKTYLNFRNNLFMLYKNLPSQSFYAVMAVRFFLDYLAALQLLLTGKPSNALAVLNARRDYRKAVPSLRIKRSRQKQLMHPEIFKGSILWWFYFKRRKIAPIV